jgi:hypothetical protein
MSLQSLIVIASLIAAVAFFVAGWLLAPRPRPATAVRPIGPAPVPTPNDGEKLRRAREDLEQALAAAEARCLQERENGKREAARRAAAELERDSARQEVERLAALDKTLAARLRVAEDENRAAFEREEKAAEGWAGQLAAAQAEQRRHDGTLANEVASLRAEIAQVKRERDEASRAAAAAQAEAKNVRDGKLAVETELRAQITSESELRGKLAAEAELRARAATVEADLRGKLASAESALSAHGSAAAALSEREATAAAEQAALRRELDQARIARTAAAEETQTLGLRVAAAEEVAEQRRVEAVAAAAAMRAAEERAKDRDRLAQENDELRAERIQAEQDRRERAQKDDDARDARVELAAAQAKLADLARFQEDNRRLRDEVAELRAHEQASAELERLQVAHKQVRLDAELMARRLQELLHDQAELGPLRAQAAEAVSLAEEVEYLRRREKDLEAQLYALGSYSSRSMPAVSGELPMLAPGSDLETNLGTLVGADGPRTAVLADAQGFLIAAAGESVAEEGLAAFAAVAGEMVSRARMLLPLADVRSVRLTDANRMVLTCHLFASSGEGLGITTLGPGEPKAESTARAIAGLATIVSGPESTAEETPEPATH